MDNRCPKCDKKLSFWYIKQNCPHCGCDLLYYNIDERLEKDSIKAEAEFEKLNSFKDKVIPSFLKNRRTK